MLSLLIGSLLAILSIVIPAAILLGVTFPVSRRWRLRWRRWARITGYYLTIMGWLYFFVILRQEFSVLAPEDAGTLKAAGFFIVIGWLLLRFAAGLFPFGRHFFKWQK